jgi:hypothetical protein
VSAWRRSTKASQRPRTRTVPDDETLDRFYVALMKRDYLKPLPPPPLHKMAALRALAETNQLNETNER